MASRLWVAASFVIAAALLINAVQAADKSHEGIVVSVAEGKLVMTDKEGKNEHSHQIGSAAKITLNGKPAKLAEMKKGDHVKVTQDDAGKVVAVEGKRP